MSDFTVIITDEPTEINLTFEDPAPIEVKFSEVALPDASVIANRVLAQEAAIAAAASSTSANASAASAIVSASQANDSAVAAATSETNAANSEGAANTFASNAASSSADAALSSTDSYDASLVSIQKASEAAASASAALASETAAQSILTTLTNGYLYLGDPSTNGTWRFFNDAGTLRLQKRVSAVWETLNEYTYP